MMGWAASRGDPIAPMSKPAMSPPPAIPSNSPVKSSSWPIPKLTAGSSMSALTSVTPTSEGVIAPEASSGEVLRLRERCRSAE